MSSDINILVEGLTDAHVVSRLFDYLGLVFNKPIRQKQKPGLRDVVEKYNQAAQLANWFILIDLDNDDDCAVTYRQGLVAQPAPGLCLRIAVRSMESWLLADRERIASYLKVSLQKVPAYPDQVTNPKLALIELARTSRDKYIRNDIVPTTFIGNRGGEGYEGRVAEFVRNYWRPEVAAQNSDSLARCIRALQNWQPIPKDSL